MIRNLSDNLILPSAGVILALVATLELIQMIVDRNNMHDMDTFMPVSYTHLVYIEMISGILEKYPSG